MAQLKPTSDTGGIAAIDSGKSTPRTNLKAHHSAGHCLRRAVATSLIVQLIGHIAHHVYIHDRAGADRNIAVFVWTSSIGDRPLDQQVADGRSLSEGVRATHAGFPAGPQLCS